MSKITSKQLRDAVQSSEVKSLEPPVQIEKTGHQFTVTDRNNVLKFVFSSKVVDLSGDRVFPAGIDTRMYMAKNPIILLHHDRFSFGIGKTIALEVIGDQLIGDIEFFVDLEHGGIGDKARATMELIKRGVMGISITFIPKAFDLNTTDGLDISESLLIETSCVTIPCCPESFVIPSVVVPDMIAASAPEAPAENIADLLAIKRARDAAARRRAIQIID